MLLCVKAFTMDVSWFLSIVNDIKLLAQINNNSYLGNILFIFFNEENHDGIYVFLCAYLFTVI